MTGGQKMIEAKIGEPILIKAREGDCLMLEKGLHGYWKIESGIAPVGYHLENAIQIGGDIMKIGNSWLKLEDGNNE
jgi:hypothetical protein